MIWIKVYTDLGGEHHFLLATLKSILGTICLVQRFLEANLLTCIQQQLSQWRKIQYSTALYIFKNAYIPYKDAETLRLFLSQIDDFEYSKDSEQLGDAFEHILNSLILKEMQDNLELQDTLSTLLLK